MGDVAEEALLAADEAGEAPGHLVDGMPEGAEFIAPAFVEADVELAFGDTLGGFGHLGNGAVDAKGEGEPEQGSQEHGGGADDEPWSQVEEQSAAAEGVGHDNQTNGHAAFSGSRHSRDD